MMPTPTGGHSPWLHRYSKKPDNLTRLVCFPHAGGSASYFFGLSKALPTVDVWAVQYPGRQDRRRELLLDDVPRLAEGVYDAFAQDGRPTAFFGHSLGAVIAFEVATRLEHRRGTSLLHLLVSGRRAPSRYRRGSVHQADDHALVTRLRHLGGTDELFLTDPELRADVLRITRADYKAAETYRWASGEPLACPITALVGDSDPEATIEDAAAWKRHTTAAFDLKVFAGGHFYLEDHWQDVTRVIGEGLDAGTYTRKPRVPRGTES